MPLHKKIIGNAVVSYFLIFVSLSFLWSKQKYLDHPFVKSHVKVACILHVLLLGVIIIMSYPFLESITLFEYSLNTLITILLLLSIFTGILYWAFTAYKWDTISIWEMFQSVGGVQGFFKESSSETLWEESTLILVLAHIPFVWYIFAARHPQLPHMRDISMLNMMITILGIFLTVIGSISLASIIMLGYTIWSVYQSIKLILSHEFSSINTLIIPTPREKFILQSSLLSYVGNSLKNNRFVPLKEIITSRKNTFTKKVLHKQQEIQQLKASPIPSWIFYTPFINGIGIFFLKSQDTHHIQHGLIITFITIILILLFGYQSPVLLFVLIPICYGIWHLDQKSYMMPYIYEVAQWIKNLFLKIFYLGRKTRELQKTDKKISVKIGEKK